jgi:3-hydroxybutyryl-CoA dehydrogenase
LTKIVLTNLADDREMTAKKPTQHKQPATHKSSQIYIIGESPLVEEYAELCAAKGYSVTVAWNQPPKSKPVLSSKSVRISAIVPSEVSVALELTNTTVAQKRKNLEKLDKALVATAPLLTSSVTVSATEQSSWVVQKHRLVGIGALPTFVDKPLVEVAPTVFSPMETMEVVGRFFASLGKDIEVVQDRVGMVLPRILCQIINESIFAITDDVAKPTDIDNAMKLGANYPLGPVEWAEKIGINQVCAVLTAIQNDLNEDRYRVSPLLKQMSIAGEWWKS